MNNKAINVLEYNKIIDMLSVKAGSEMTRKRISELQPYNDPFDVEEGLDESLEAVELIEQKGPLPVGSFYDIKKLMDMAKKGGSLTMGELLKVKYNLAIAREVVTFTKTELEVPIIKSICQVVQVFRELEKDIDRCILSEDEMADGASPALKSIRRNMTKQNEQVRVKINKIINSPANKTVLQDAIVTLRDGRYVVPVKAEHKSVIQGIVHDKSATGATLFIEPQAVVDANNKLRELELEEQAEIVRILRDLTERVALNYDEINNNQKLLVRLDFINAKGEFALDIGGSRPDMNQEGRLILTGARHPLINPEKMVPIDIKIGENYKALIVTGPNTGGKTVTLKICGLLTMMAQSGLLIPAAPGCEIPICRDIFADIGDEQNIEQSLSTFSSHMKNIVEIVKNADEKTLVLMDELGAGTDPTEGAALAISILERLMEKGALILASTHYAELKKYAVTREGVQNASMQFDVETLSPTYKLILGLPGKSNAFEIAGKLGLDKGIIDQARHLLEGENLAFEDVLTAIEADKKAASKEKDEAVMLNIQLKKLKEQMTKEQKKSAEESQKIVNEAKRKAREIIRDAKDISRDVQEDLKELNKLESMGERNKRLEDNKRQLNEAENKYKETIVKEVNENPVNIKDLKIGDRVKVLSLDQNGDVVALADSKGDVTVQVGIMKVKVKASDLMAVHDGHTKRKKPREKFGRSKYASMQKAKAQTLPTSIMVRHQTLDEAVAHVLKYLDDAVLAGADQVAIIHGKGEGILKRGIHEELKKHKNVKSFRMGNYNEGDDGVTIVTMKK